MKKLIAVITCALLLVCTVVPFCSSAAGRILWTDDFSEVVEDNWMWPDTLFEIKDGKLDGWSEAVAHQAKYREEDNGNRKFNDCTIKITAHGLEDGGEGSDNHTLALWFADYLSEDGSEDATTGQIVYKWEYCFEEQAMNLYIEFARDAEAFIPSDWVNGGTPYRTYPVTGKAPQLDSDESEAFTLGLRVNGAVLSGYLNDKKIMDFNTIRGTTSFKQRPSPLVLLNGKCHAQFDDLIVATVDYDLFNEGNIGEVTGGGNNNEVTGGGNNVGGGGNNNVGGGNNNVGTKVETKVEQVTDEKGNAVTDASGNAVTQVVTEIVTIPSADLNNGASGNGGAQTGDMAVVVVAVMVIALGSAITVKKVSEK